MEVEEEEEESARVGRRKPQHHNEEEIMPSQKNCQQVSKDLKKARRI